MVRFLLSRLFLASAVDQELQDPACGTRIFAEKSRARKNEFLEPDQRDLPCPDLLEKIFRLTRRANQR
jgi:hypothetical protein